MKPSSLNAFSKMSEKVREMKNLLLGNFGCVLYAFNALLPVFGMIVPDHDCNEAEKNRFFNFSSTGISPNHKVTYLN